MKCTARYSFHLKSMRVYKLCYFLGDLNIDLRKHENHSPTSGFLDTMCSYSMFPLITKPTIVTKDTATLIDHIFMNNYDVESKHVHGILCTSISDHYAVFHITGNTSKSSLGDSEPSLRRNMFHANIVKLRDQCQLLIGERYWIKVMPKSHIHPFID